MKRTTEERYPLVGAVILTALSIFSGIFFNSYPKLNDDILSAGITAAALFVGFNSVYRNTLQTKANKIIQNMEDTKYMKQYHKYLKAVTNSGLYFILVSFVIMFFTKNAQEHFVAFNIWFCFAVYMVLCFYRANSIDDILVQSK